LEIFPSFHPSSSPFQIGALGKCILSVVLDVQ
jgi:hypothetical protein